MVTSSKKHICIDFEGEGKKADGSVPHPSILGALVPNIDGQGSRYFLWVFEKELTPLTRSPKITGRPENRKVCSLEEAILDLINLADERECRLIAYSDHELNMVNMHLGQKSDARKGFEARFYNILPKSRALTNRRRLKKEDNKLKTLLSALSPSHKWPPPPKVGVAEACRRLRTAGTKSKRWRKWSPKHQQMAEELIAYNRGDCKAVWRLTNRVSSNYKIAELIITPQDTISRLSRLSLTDNQFSTIHHFDDMTTVKSHVRYLEGLTRGYQVNGNNYVVALRLDAIESMKKEGVSINEAIKKATSTFPFNQE